MEKAPVNNLRCCCSPKMERPEAIDGGGRTRSNSPGLKLVAAESRKEDGTEPPERTTHVTASAVMSHCLTPEKGKVTGGRAGAEDLIAGGDELGAALGFVVERGRRLRRWAGIGCS